jgi:hypothetical protein
MSTDDATLVLLRPCADVGKAAGTPRIEIPSGTVRVVVPLLLVLLLSALIAAAYVLILAMVDPRVTADR